MRREDCDPFVVYRTFVGNPPSVKNCYHFYPAVEPGQQSVVVEWVGGNIQLFFRHNR
jgi:hypothetical protein